VLAGDVTTGEGTVTHAIGSGRRAATLALRDAGLDVRVFERPSKDATVPATDIRLDHFAPAVPARESHTAPASRIESFEPVNLGLPDALEAHRCFSCGHCIRCDTCLVYCPEGAIQRVMQGYDVDYDFCKGCGICVAECPRTGMEMVDL
jgi:2-oxoacid:acceptor oxidoreductase delta subunit (pyruvate/2-ketoisovalerate family)